MSDTPIETMPAAKEILASSPLLQRLMRRGTEPLGLINARQPQDLYDRTAGWIAQRFGLIDNLRFRYDLRNESRSGGTSTSLVFNTASAQSPAETISAFPPVAQASSAMEKPFVASTPSSAAVQDLPAKKMRVSRRATPQSERIQAKLLPEAKAELKSGREQIKKETSDTLRRYESTPTAAVASSEISSFSRPPNLILPKPTSALGPVESALAESGPHTAELASAVSAVSETVKDAPKPPEMVQSGEVAKSIAKSSELNQISASPASAVPLRGMRKSSLQQPVALRAKSTGTSIGAEIPPSVAQENIKAKGFSPEPSTLLFAKSSLISPETRRGQEAQSIREAHHHPMPSVVWRKSAPESSPKDSFAAGTNEGMRAPLILRTSPANASMPVIARQETSATASTTVPAAPANTETVTPPAPSAPVQTRENDARQVAEKVKRMLFHELAVERERRGIGRWN